MLLENLKSLHEKEIIKTMNKERVKQLQEMLKENPEDPFLHYAIALEYKNHDQETAKKLFDSLLSIFPGYLPTYYPAAEVYIETEDYKKAKNCYEKGILLAKKLENEHSLKELKNAYQNFIIDLD